MTGRLAGKVALITGAAQGQGAAEARRFAAEGAKVVVADVQYDKARAMVGEVGVSSAMVAPLDVTDPEQWDRAVRAALDAFGRLDILVNNAGIAVPPTLLDDVSLEDPGRERRQGRCCGDRQAASGGGGDPWQALDA